MAQSWYRNGTVTIASGSTQVNGDATFWQMTVQAGDRFTLDSDKFYEITAIDSSGKNLTIRPAYSGPSITAIAQVTSLAVPAQAETGAVVTNLTINGVDYSHTSDATPTAGEIALGLVDTINGTPTAPVIAATSATGGSATATVVLTAKVAGGLVAIASTSLAVTTTTPPAYGAAYAIDRNLASTTNADLAARLANFIFRQEFHENQFADWLAGTPDGGPNGDGKYPLTNALGVTRLVESPAFLMQLVGDGVGDAVNQIIAAIEDDVDRAELAADRADAAILQVAADRDAVELDRQEVATNATSVATATPIAVASAAAAALSEENAAASEAAASASEANTGGFASAAAASAAAALASQTTASTAATTATGAAASATASATTATDKATSATASASSAKVSELIAIQNRDTAVSAASAAQESAASAGVAATIATTAATTATGAAATATSAAGTASAAAATSATNATTSTASASAAATSATTATTAATTATGAATTATGAAATAVTAATSAEDNVATAVAAAVGASASADGAGVSAQVANDRAEEAELAATAASTAATTATDKAAVATAQAATATAKAAEASGYLATVQASATAAATSATGAETAKMAAQGSQVTASTAATTATDKATASSASAENAYNSAQAAAVSATDALNAKTDMANALSTTQTARDTALAHRDKAFQWAQANIDVQVEPGLYSAYHHALRAKGSADQAAAIVGGQTFGIVTDGSGLTKFAAASASDALSFASGSGVAISFDGPNRRITISNTNADIEAAPGSPIMTMIDPDSGDKLIDLDPSAISHAELADVGTNTHAQIDSFIDATTSSLAAHDTAIAALDSDKLNVSARGAANGVAALDGTGKVPTAQLPSLDFIPTSQKGVANGVASLGSDGKVPGAQLPPLDYAPAGHVGTGGNAHALANAGAHGFMSSTDKTKLDGIASGATNYIHPTGDGNQHVPATGTTNSGKFLKAGAAAGSASWQQIVFGDIQTASLPNTLAGHGITDGQPLHAALTSISGLTTAADQLLYTTALNAYATTTLTALARSLLDDTTQTAMLATLGAQPAGNYLVSGASALVGTLGVSGGLTVANGAGNTAIEIGRTDGTASSSFFDFHTGATAIDYDVRIIASGGNGSNGGGTLNIGATAFQWNGNSLLTVASGTAVNSSQLNGQPASHYLNPVNLSTAVPVSKGGTNLTATPTNGQIPIGNATGYTLGTIAGAANQVTVTNGPGTITLALPQNIHSGAAPTFTRLTLIEGTGNAPLTVSSTTEVPNLNAELHGGLRRWESTEITGNNPSNEFVKIGRFSGVQGERLLVELSGHSGYGNNAAAGLYDGGVTKIMATLGNNAGTSGANCMSSFTWTGVQGLDGVKFVQAGTDRYAYDVYLLRRSYAGFAMRVSTSGTWAQSIAYGQTDPGVDSATVRAATSLGQSVTSSQVSVNGTASTIAQRDASGGLSAVGFVASASTPSYHLHEAGAVADAKRSDMVNAGGKTMFRFLNDAWSAANSWLEVTRSGYVPLLAEFKVQLRTTLGALGTAAGNDLVADTKAATTASNGDGLITRLYRATTTAGWAGAFWELRRRVDGTDMGFLRFGDGNGGQTVEIGSGTTSRVSVSATGVTLTGTVTAPTPVAGTNTTQVATMAALQTAVSGVSLPQALGTGASPTFAGMTLNGGVAYSNAVGDKLSLFGGLSNTNTYGFGIEGGTLYAKSAGTYRWYILANADGGTSHKMHLDANALTMNASNFNLARSGYATVSMGNADGGWVLSDETPFSWVQWRSDTGFSVFGRAREMLDSKYLGYARDRINVIGTGNTLIHTSNIQRVRLTGNTTLTLPDVTLDEQVNDSLTITVDLQQDGTGSRTITWAAPAGQTIAWHNSASVPAISTAANKRTRYTFVRDAGETMWLATQMWKQA